MFACDGHTISANSRKRHVRLKRPFVGLPIGQQKSCAQGDDFIGSATVRPEQPGPSRLRPVAKMLEDQHKSAKPAGDAAELFDRIGYRSLVPRRHKREMNIGWRDQPDRQLFESCGKVRELSCDLRRNLQTYKHARGREGEAASSLVKPDKGCFGDDVLARLPLRLAAGRLVAERQLVDRKGQ